ncbi:MAG: hypothetical protein FD180_385 [Planctomycetota bacterium]|nr:MAG: hypothetical protein FD180_385 [Planctomycetota bacterium]
MAKTPVRSHQAWTAKETRDLASRAAENMPTRVIALKHQRSPDAIYTKASSAGTSLKPTNQSPYNRRKS